MAKVPVDPEQKPVAKKAASRKVVGLDGVRKVPVKPAKAPPPPSVAEPIAAKVKSAKTADIIPKTLEAAIVEAAPSEALAESAAADESKPTKKLKKPRTRRRKLIEIGALVLLLLLAGGGWWYFHRPIAAPTAEKVTHPKPKPIPKTIYAALTGLPVPDQATAEQPVIGVMIENLDPDARPQSGLGQAGMVYEALAEGGITRFLAIFQEPLPSTIGPVRSLRPYYLDWGLALGIPVAHAGGSQPALSEVGPLGLKDINALAYDGSSFYRTTDRLAPHNLYTNAQLLTQLDQKLGYATAPTFTPLPRKADAPVANPPHPTIDITFSYADYNVEYRYDAKTDSYARFMAGTPHVDRNTNQQIYVKNVVVEYVPTTYSTQADGDPETDMNLIGQGKALVFDDGTVTTGTWNKASTAGQTTLEDTNGKPIALNRGNTWFEVVPTTNSVTY